MWYSQSYTSENWSMEFFLSYENECFIECYQDNIYRVASSKFSAFNIWSKQFELFEQEFTFSILFSFFFILLLCNLESGFAENEAIFESQSYTFHIKSGVENLRLETSNTGYNNQNNNIRLRYRLQITEETVWNSLLCSLLWHSLLILFDIVYSGSNYVSGTHLIRSLFW